MLSKSLLIKASATSINPFSQLLASHIIKQKNKSVNYNITIKRQLCFKLSSLSRFESIKFEKVAVSVVLVATSVLQKCTVKVDTCSYLYSGPKIVIDFLVLDYFAFGHVRKFDLEQRLVLILG